MSKHTQGPWELFILNKELSDVPAYVKQCIDSCDGKDFYFILSKDERGEVDVAHIGNGPRAIANGRLMAAAPDLLEALKDVVDVMTGQMDGETVALHNALAAIAKATGEQDADDYQKRNDDLWRLGRSVGK